jgi:hypothetical protein
MKELLNRITSNLSDDGDSEMGIERHLGTGEIRYSEKKNLLHAVRKSSRPTDRGKARPEGKESWRNLSNQQKELT